MSTVTTGNAIHVRKERSTQQRQLFPFERVFEAADGVLNLALYLVGLPSDSSLASPTVLPTTSLTAPLIPFADPTARFVSIISA
jgi:hypothetical protein